MIQNYYYRGLYKVKVLTESEGYWIVEAQENFNDTVNGEKINVKTGETRIVERADLHKHKFLPRPVPEHVYERRLESKVKKMVAAFEKQ
jgi:hypothetical protein